MGKLNIQVGSTSQTINIFIQDSSVNTGVGLTGLAFNTSGFSASYARSRSARVAITLATQTVTGAFSSGGFVEIDPVNMPGLYRLDIPNAALASGSRFVDIMLLGAANMVPCVLEIELTATNNQDAAAFGMTNLDTTVSSRLATSGYTAPDNSTIAAIQAKTTNLPASPANEVTLATVAGYVDTEVAAIKAKTDNLPATPANEATLSTIASYIDTEVAAIKAKTDNLPASPAAVGSAMTLTSGERDSIATAILKLDISAISGEASRSLLNAIRFLRNKWSVSGATLTVTKEDDTTTAWTSTLTTNASADPITGSDPS